MSFDTELTDYFTINVSDVVCLFTHVIKAVVRRYHCFFTKIGRLSRINEERLHLRIQFETTMT